jgi:hypothetical protein
VRAAEEHQNAANNNSAELVIAELCSAVGIKIRQPAGRRHHRAAPLILLLEHEKI